MASIKTSNNTSNTSDKLHEFYMNYSSQLDEINNNKETILYPQFNRYLDLERHMKRNNEYFDIHGKFPPIIEAMFYSKKRRRLEKKYYVELINLHILNDELDKKNKNLRKKKNNIGSSFIHEYSKLQKITNKNKKQLELETCSICFDNHKINKMITTCCGHHFGRMCFAKYIDLNFDNHNDIVCPLCRNDNLEYFTKYH